MKMNNYLDEIDYGDDEHYALEYISSRMLHDMNKKQSFDLMVTNPGYFSSYHLMCNRVEL